MRMGQMTCVRQQLALTLAMVLAITILSAPTALGTPKPPTEPAVTYYLALGDSLAVGYQQEVPTDKGYVDDLYDTLKAGQPGLKLVNLGCPGESTTTMINGNCPYQLENPTYKPYETRSQLGDAKKFIKEHPGQVSYITITIGSNDVLRSSTPPYESCVDLVTGIIPACALAGISDVHHNLPTILQPLQELTGRKTLRAGMTYYDPYLAAWLQGESGQALAKQSLTFINLLNSVLAIGYLGNGFRVAPVSFAFQTNNFAPQNFPPFGQVPTNVVNICTYTLMCSLGDIHATEAGYSKIADVFAKTFGRW
jgi:lysophospholipase L1-like esterase